VSGASMCPGVRLTAPLAQRRAAKNSRKRPAHFSARTPPTTSAQPPATTSAQPPATTGSEEDKPSTPGFELVALVGALAVALVLVRRKL